MRNSLKVSANDLYLEPTSVDDSAEWDWQERKRNAVSKLLLGEEAKRISRMLEVACRNGRATRYFADLLGVTEAHGSDISLSGMTGCESRGIITHEWIAGENDLPLEDNSIDLVLAMDVIEHVLDPEEFLQPLHRVLKPGGILLITTPNLSWWWNRVRLMLGKPPCGSPGISSRYAYDQACDTKHIRVGTIKEWSSMLFEEGFVVQRLKGYNYPRHLRLPSWMLDDVITRLPVLAHSFAILAIKRKAY